jgi:hypothetical protein
MSKIEVNQISSQCGSTLTIGQSGDTIQLACGATQSGFGRTGTVDWDTTAKTASFTAVSGTGYFVNTTSGVITITLPAGSAGSIVSLKDYANTWNTNNVTVTPNGTDKINGVNENATLNTQDQSVTLVYVDSTKGWRVVQDSTSSVDGVSYIIATGGTITCCGDYKIHTFTGPGTFCVSQISTSAANNEVSYVVVAGGGGGGSNYAGGGGAGGFRESKSGVDCYSASPLEGSTNITVTATAFPIAVGGGGSGGTSNAGGPSGTASTFSTVTSAGGGGGGSVGNPSTLAGANGGSGGGNSNDSGPLSAPSGNTPPVSPPQGNNGGRGRVNPAYNGAGGGGGATAVGGNGGCGSTSQGPGGAGVSTSITGSSVARAGGGGGGGQAPNFPGAAGGSGGGGAGSGCTSGPGGSPGTPGTTNTGGGGGGATCGPNTGGAGGSGIVIIRYKFQ